MNDFEGNEWGIGIGTDGAAVGEIVDAAGGDEELAEGFEGALAVEAEIEVIVGEDVYDVIDDWLVHVDHPLPQNVVHHWSRHLRHLPPL